MEIWIFFNATYERFLILLKIDTYMNNIKFRVGSYLITDLTFIRCNETNLHLCTLLCLFLQFGKWKGHLVWPVEPVKVDHLQRWSQIFWLKPNRNGPFHLISNQNFWNFGLNWRFSMCLLARGFHLWEVNPAGFGGEIAGTRVRCLCMSVNTNL